MAPTLTPTTTVINAITVGSGPSGASIAGGFAYVINYDSNNVTVIDTATNNRLYVNATDRRITVIDTTNDANLIIGTAPLGTFRDLKVSPDGTRLYGTSGGDLTVINRAP